MSTGTRREQCPFCFLPSLAPNHDRVKDPQWKRRDRYYVLSSDFPNSIVVVDKRLGAHYANLSFDKQAKGHCCKIDLLSPSDPLSIYPSRVSLSSPAEILVKNATWVESSSRRAQFLAADYSPPTLCRNGPRTELFRRCRCCVIVTVRETAKFPLLRGLPQPCSIQYPDIQHPFGDAG